MIRVMVVMENATGDERIVVTVLQDEYDPVGAVAVAKKSILDSDAHVYVIGDPAKGEVEVTAQEAEEWWA